MEFTHQFKLGADPGQIAGLQESLADILAVSEVRPKIAQGLNLAVEEILICVMEAYKARLESLSMTVSLVGREGQVCVSISFEGEPFNPLDVPGPDLDSPIGERNPRGYGIHLARQHVDRLDYRRENHVNTITLIKELPFY